MFLSELLSPLHPDLDSHLFEEEERRKARAAQGGGSAEATPEDDAPENWGRERESEAEPEMKVPPFARGGNLSGSVFALEEPVAEGMQDTLAEDDPGEGIDKTDLGDRFAPASHPTRAAGPGVTGGGLRGGPKSVAEAWSVSSEPATQATAPAPPGVTGGGLRGGPKSVAEAWSVSSEPAPRPAVPAQGQTPGREGAGKTGAPGRNQEKLGNPAVTTTIHIGAYPKSDPNRDEKQDIDHWNTKFRDTYGGFAVDAARKVGVPVRLLAALSANEMGAADWTPVDAWRDRNGYASSYGPLQISLVTAIEQSLVPLEHGDYYAITSNTFESMLKNNDTIHSYLDNPATCFEAGAKLLQIYLQRLVDDYKSGDYLNYSEDFKKRTLLDAPQSGIFEDLKVLASGDKNAIFNLRFSRELGLALAMMWNNGPKIVHVKDLGKDSPGAVTHGGNMENQVGQQDNLIPAGPSPQHGNRP